MYVQIASCSRKCIPLFKKAIVLVIKDFNYLVYICLVYIRGHQHGARGHQVARKDHMSRPQACSKNSTTQLRIKLYFILLLFFFLITLAFIYI